MTHGAPLTAEEPQLRPSRLFFSDAHISFIFPQHWTLNPSFPFGHLFQKTTREGTEAFISCVISQPLWKDRLKSDIPPETIRELARQDLANREPGFKLLAEADGRLAGQNSYDITWEHQKEGAAWQNKTIYFFVQNRVYALALHARSDSFLWLVPDFQGWLNSVRILSRQGSGSLSDPSHGGLWIHQTGGVRILIPQHWLIAVSDDRTLGAALVQSKHHSEWTATVDLAGRGHRSLNEREKREARQTLIRKGYKVTAESDEPFHGLPAYWITYEGVSQDRFIKGQDLWVTSPKARWLFSVEADAPLYRDLTQDYEAIFNGIQFL